MHPEDKWDLLDAEVLKWILDRHFSHTLVREFLEVRKVKGTLPDYDAHEKIYRAIRNGNSEAAFKSCRELIKEALMLVIKMDKKKTAS